MNTNNKKFIKQLAYNSLDKAISKLGKRNTLKIIESISNPIFRAIYRNIYFEYIKNKKE